MTCPVLTQSEIFFFISSVGFITLWIFLCVLLVYTVRAMKTFNRIAESVEKDVDHIGDTTKEMLEDVRDSNIYRLFIGKKKRKHKEPKA